MKFSIFATACVAIALGAWFALSRRGQRPNGKKEQLEKVFTDGNLQEAMSALKAHSRKLEGLLEDLYQAMESNSEVTIRRKLATWESRFRHFDECPSVPEWFAHVSKDYKTANLAALKTMAGTVFDNLKTAGIERCGDTQVPDSGETLSRYIFTGEDGAADGGPYEVIKAAWIMDGRIVVEKGFIENMGH